MSRSVRLSSLGPPFTAGDGYRRFRELCQEAVQSLAADAARPT
jgi:hypothetical protein